MVSRDAQEAVVRRILELCPWSKIVWSTDGHWFPETYLLAVMQIRETLETVSTRSPARRHARAHKSLTPANRFCPDIFKRETSPCRLLSS